MPHGCDLHNCLSSGIAFVPLLPSPSPAYIVPSVFPWSPVPCWLGCWISPPPSGETGKLEVTAGRTSFSSSWSKIWELCSNKVFSSGKEALVAEKIWACFTMVLLGLPLPKRGESFLDPRGENPVEFLEGKAHQNSVTSKTVSPGISYSHTTSHSISSNLSVYGSSGFCFR